MHITFAMVGATFGFKPSIKLCFLICYLHIIVFTPLFNVFFLRCLFVILCFILYFAFFPSFFHLLFIPAPNLIPILYGAVQSEDKDLLFGLLVWNKKEICVFLKP
jgi:quinol-cytochrome oxidoreductase complex cytochrome b subunit